MENLADAILLEALFATWMGLAFYAEPGGDHIARRQFRHRLRCIMRED